MIKKIPFILCMALACCSLTACGDGDTVSSQADEGNRVTENTDGFHDDENKNSTDSNNVVEEIVTEAGEAVDDLVSKGEEIVTDIGGAVNDMVDGTSTTEVTK